MARGIHLDSCNASRRIDGVSGRSCRGAVLVLLALMLVALLALVAFAIDVGYILLARTELQRCADAAAMAAGWELLDQTRLVDPASMALVEASARNVAAQYASLNTVCSAGPQVSLNSGNAPEGEIVFGRFTREEGFSTGVAAELYNAVLVRVRRTNERNGEVPMFFARVLGFNSTPVEAEAVATFRDGITGFRVTEKTGNAGLLPFALSIDEWNRVLDGGRPDEWAYDPDTKAIFAGSDGFGETKLFPGAPDSNGFIEPGNFGTVDIGSPDNSSSALRRQIVDGMSETDLAYHGGELSLDESTGTLELNGDTGLDADLTLALNQIIGQPRIIPLYSKIEGNGNTAMYTIVAFAGIRILDFNLRGKNKYITIQRAIVVDDTAISRDGEPSYGVYQPVILVR